MPPCSRRTRREFLKTGLAAGTLAMSGALPLGARLGAAQRGKATDVVTLGRSGVNVTRLAFGTGSFSGRVQRDLGQDGFTRLVRHAYDSGIRFFETAESYGEMHRMLGVALKGIPRDTYQIMSKVTTRNGSRLCPPSKRTSSPSRQREMPIRGASLTSISPPDRGPG